MPCANVPVTAPASTRHTARTYRTEDDVQAVVQELEELQQVQQTYLAKISQEQEKREGLTMRIQVCDFVQPGFPISRVPQADALVVGCKCSQIGRAHV